MDTLEEIKPKHDPENISIKNCKTLSVTSNKITTDSEEGVGVAEENRSIFAMKKMYSIDRIAFNVESKCEDQNISNDKLLKFRTSSCNLERDHAYYEMKALSKLSFGERMLRTSGNDLFLLDILEMKKFALTTYIQENPMAADLKWSLFCAACHSYRYDSVLRPFPPMFVDNEIKDIDKLRDVAESCPTINVIFDQTQERSSDIISTDLINLLYWVLIHNREPQLKLVPKDMHSSILSQVSSVTTPAAPHYIFQVQYNKRLDQQKFVELTKDYKITNAYHGARLDNFYSILYYGLHISFNKLNSYSPGIYLSKDMNVSLSCSPTGYSWGGSYFGSQISIVALCEMIDHPGVIHPEDTSKKRRKNLMTDLDEISENIFIVPNSDLVRVKYLLMYCASVPEPDSNQLSATVAWFQKNKVIAVVIAYVFLLMAIATSNSSTCIRYYGRLARKLGVGAINV